MSRNDAQILEVIDAAISESRSRAGKWIACRAGCSECCYAAFPVTALDAERLRRGLATLDSARAEAIRERARRYVEAILLEFPGEWQSGRLDDNDEWRDWFFARMKGRAACPALDEARGECELYEHRPVACRVYGHLIQIGETAPGMCRLCFVGAQAQEIEAARVGVEDAAAIDEPGLADGETLVAFALAGQ